LPGSPPPGVRQRLQADWVAHIPDEPAPRKTARRISPCLGLRRTILNEKEHDGKSRVTEVSPPRLHGYASDRPATPTFIAPTEAGGNGLLLQNKRKAAPSPVARYRWIAMPTGGASTDTVNYSPAARSRPSWITRQPRRSQAF
jgi:hypothetical protein